MIFLKNLFLLLLLSLSLFAQQSTIISQEIVLTDSPEELIGNEVHPYEVINPPQNISKIEEQMKSTIKNISLNTTKETYPIVESTTPSTPPTEENLPKNFDDALAQAKKEHKVILIEVYGTNCHFCEKMESETFPKESVNKVLKENFILLKINGDEEEIPLGVPMQMTPMHVFVTENEDIDIKLGFLKEKEFLELLNKEKN